MPVKHFSINPNRKESDKGDIALIQRESEQIMREWDKSIVDKKKSQISDKETLTHVQDRVVVKVDIDKKNTHRFESGIEIRRERNFNEFNRRITQPVNVEVISGEGMPEGSEILVDHNAMHETNRICDYKNTFENAESDKVRYFSIPLYECYAWREQGGKWEPMPTFDFALRVFKPYEGFMQGIAPTLVKDVLFVTTGELKGQVVKTVVAADYQIIYQADNGRENYLIRFRPNGDQKRGLEEEALAILHDITDKVNSGEYLIGYEVKDAKPLKELVSNH